jgi:N-acetylmuramoyl-L-alanine amidase
MRRLRVVLAALVVLGACSSSGGAAVDPTTSGAPTTTTTTSPTSTPTTPSTAPPTTAGTTIPPPPDWSVPGVSPAWAPVPTSGPVKAVVTPKGIVLPVTGGSAGAWAVKTPCSASATVAGTPLYGADVVLDPGHGGEEYGATGPTGVKEKDVNFAVAEDVKAMLEQAGATVVLTRTADYRITLVTRGAIGGALHPQAFVSIHHNAEPDGPSAGPGSETYYQIASPESKRLAGLVYEEVHKAFAPYAISWVADTDAGAKYRLSSSGGDYYGILRDTAGITASLSEAAFVSNAPEEQLLATPAFQHVEAAAITRAIIRFVGTDDPGSGFVTPYPRTFESAGPGGSAAGCDDPALS